MCSALWVSYCSGSISVYIHNNIIITVCQITLKHNTGPHLSAPVSDERKTSISVYIRPTDCSRVIHKDRTHSTTNSAQFILLLGCKKIGLLWH